MKEARHPRCDCRLLFDEGPHEYRMAAGGVYPDRWEDATPLPSVTQFVGHYCPTFNGRQIAECKARRDGRTPEEVQAEWEAAAAMGTRVHANQEHLMRGEYPSEPPLDAREKAIMSAGWEAFHAILEAGWRPMAAELMVFSPVYLLCGTVDAIFRRQREVLIVDWKTNKVLHAKGHLGELMLPPVAHLQNCCMSKYGLQLSLYRRILLHEGYIQASTPPRMMLVHLTPDGYRAHTITDMPEADVLLLDYLTNNWFKGDVPF